MVAIQFVYGQEASKTYQELASISDRDIAETISSLRSDDPAVRVAQFNQKLSSAISSEAMRAKALKRLVDKWGSVQHIDAKFESHVRKLINPALALYGRNQIYKLLILKHKTPFVMSHPYGVLVITTGLIKDVQNDDEILGIVAHEVGHEYFIDYTKYTEHLIKITGENGSEKPLMRRFTSVMALLELLCDGFMSVTLAYLGYDPLAMVDGLDRMNRNYPIDPNSYHPPNRIRRQVTLGVLPSAYANALPKRRVSPILLELKKQVRSLNRSSSGFKPVGSSASHTFPIRNPSSIKI